MDLSSDSFVRAPMTRQGGRGPVLATLALCAMAACARVREGESVAEDVSTAVSTAVERTDLVAIDGRRNGGRLLLARAGDRRVVLVSDDEADAIRVLDPFSRRQLSM